MSKKATNTRVFQLAKELGVTSKDIIAKCESEEIPGITNHMSAVSLGLATTVREWFSAGTEDSAVATATAVERAPRVDVSAARAKAKRKAGKKKTTTKTESAAAKTKPVAKSKSPDVEVAQEDIPSAAQSATPEIGDKAAPPAAAEELESPAPIADTPQVAAKAPKSRKKPPAEPIESDVPEPAQEETPAPARPIMNVPLRPEVIAAGPKLQEPTRSQVAGPRVIRVEAPEVVPAPTARRSRTDSPVGRGGPQTGRGTVGRLPDDSEAPGSPIRGRGGSPGAGSRRNKRRTASARPEAGRSGRAGTGSGAGTGDNRGFNWREQDLLERERRLNRSAGFIRAARRDNLKRGAGGGHRALSAAESGGKVKIEEPITIKALSSITGVKMNDLVRQLVKSGRPLVSPDAAIESETALELMLEHGIDLEIVEQQTAEQQIAQQFRERELVDERSRPPVVTILGHVDHGKTTLLDKIRNANVAAGEAGGITQATSAFQVPVHVGDVKHMVTFIDTPGHEAFTEMRSRGAKVTDIVVLVVAADDGVMPQTVESINHAKAAGVPIIVALNKIDKPEATDSNIQRILGQLAEHELNPVEWGGRTEVVRISALKNQGIQELLELLDYQSQLLELTADFGGQAQGTVIEAQMEEGRGPVARVLVQQGHLRKGEYIAVGRAFGRVRDIVNDHGQRIDTAGPAMPVAISGINEVPDAGDTFYCVRNLRDAEASAAERKVEERERGLAREKVTLDNIFEKLAASGRKELPLVVKADVQGSLETLRATLPKIGSDEVVISIKHSAVGGVNESDIGLAEAAGAIVIGFNVTAPASARRAAEAKGVDVRFYDVIYDLSDDVKKAAEGLLDPELKLEVLGHAEVREVFKISKVGMIAGCYVTDGVVERNAQIRVTRGDIVIEKDRRLEQLKRFKDDAKEVKAGQECGMKIEGYDDIRVNDVIECYRTKSVRRKL